MRLVSIDILRSLAIITMVIIHFVENLSSFYGADGSTLGRVWLPTGFAAPLFTFLSGASYFLWWRSRESLGWSDEYISKVTIRRGLFLFVLGFLFNVCVWLPEDIFNWDILTLIGGSLLLLNIARRLPAAIIPVIVVGTLVMSPVLRAMADYPTYWTNGYFECDLTLSDVLLGFCSVGYFPLFPWMIFPLAGFMTASILFSKPSCPRATAQVAVCGVVMIACSIIAMTLRGSTPEVIQEHFLQGWRMFPPSTEYVTGTLGMVIVSLAACHHWIDRNPIIHRSEYLVKSASIFSKYSLSMYLLHHIVHLWPLWIVGMWTGDDPTHLWGNAMPKEVSFTASILFLIACFVLFRWMERTRRGGAESVLRWICD